MALMKKLPLALAVVWICSEAFAQGKVSFQQDSLHLAYYGPFTHPPDTALQGQGLDSAHMPIGIVLVADLYVGSSSTTLSLISTTTFSAAPGKWNSTSVQVPGIAGGTSVFVEVQIRDQSFAPPSTFTGIWIGTYYGVSDLFTFTLGSGITYPVMWGANGTWPAGTFPMDQYGLGARGAIQVNAMPEPTGCTLACLGLVAATIFRRYKSGGHL